MAGAESLAVKVLLFGPAREAADAGHVEVSVPAPGTLAALREALKEACPALGPLLPSSRFSVEQELVQDEASAAFSASSEVALIPPVSGG
mmetsp:Transcript_91900/g.297246  ORF Transcript_91900/g.297246 Transcript_91900/m.297246 type:complete len:90 (-) Transcript_91900:139-408(-)